MKSGKKGARVSIAGRMEFFNRLSGCAAGLSLIAKRRARAVCTLIDLRAGQRVLVVGSQTEALKKAAQKRGCDVQSAAELSAAARFDNIILFETAADASKAAELLKPGGRLTICALCGRYQANRLGARLAAAKTLAQKLCQAYTVDISVDAPTLFIVSGRQRLTL